MIELEGERFDAPAHPEDWLELNYGPGWRVPDPDFHFTVSDEIVRRFDTWFGTFNLHRDHWEAEQGSGEIGPVSASTAVTEALDGVPDAAVVVDLGAGLSGACAALRQRGINTVAVDFSLPALFAQRRAGETAYVNLNDRHRVLEFVLERAADARPTVLVLDDVLHGLGGEGKENVMLLMQWMLQGESFAVVTFPTGLPADHTFNDPTSWHLPLSDFLASVSDHGLRAVISWTGTRRDPSGRRRWTACTLVRRAEGATR